MEKGSSKTANVGIEKPRRISEFIESLKEEFADEIISKTELVFVPNIQKEMTKNRIIDLLTEFSNRLINSLPSHEHIDALVMPKAEFAPIVAHVVIKNKTAEQQLEYITSMFGNECYIDYTQSLTSYKAEQK